MSYYDPKLAKVDAPVYAALSADKERLNFQNRMAVRMPNITEPKMETQNKPGPRLQDLLDAGTVRVKPDEGYVGIGADGYDVLLGTFEDHGAIEIYLEKHPTPDTW